MCPITSAYKFILKFRFCKLIIIHKREKEYNRKFYPSSKEYENRVARKNRNSYRKIENHNDPRIFNIYWV